MRALLLWCAQNTWLAANVPRWGFARKAVRRFMPGEEFDDALKAAVEFKSKAIGAVFTKLGENIKTLHEATAVVEHYERVIAQAAAAGVEPEVSVKPTQVGLDIDPETTYTNLRRLAISAGQAQGFLWVDMEGTNYTDSTIELYKRLRRDRDNVGVCLQAYLYRTVADVTRLLPVKPSIRLVKGAYAEPADRAFPAKRDVDANYLALAVLILPEVKWGRVRLVLGTHDLPLVERIAGFGQALGVERPRVEVHMLYGIQTAGQLKLASAGYRVKDLIAYGDAWYQWYLRRLAERPANILFVARQMFG